METSAVGASTVVSTRQPTSRGFNDLGGDDFMALMIAELQAQDPMNPTDNKDLVAQMASVRQMEQSTTLNKTLQSLASEQRFGSTSSLIGHYVAGTVTDSGGTDYEIQGLVVGVRFEPGGDAILELHNGQSLPAGKVEQVTLIENLPPEIQQQLQQELAEQAGETGGDTASPSAQLIRADPRLGETKAGWAARRLGGQVNETAGLLDALLAPAIG